MRWERSLDEQWKDKLLQYNFDDCAALAAVVAFLRSAATMENAAPERSEAASASGPQIKPVEELEKPDAWCRGGHSQIPIWCS